MEGESTQVLGVVLGGYPYADMFGFVVLSAEHAVERCEIGVGIEVLGSLEGLLQHLQALDAVEGVHLGALGVARAVELVAYTEHVPSLFEHLEA